MNNNLEKMKATLTYIPTWSNILTFSNQTAHYRRLSRQVACEEEPQRNKSNMRWLRAQCKHNTSQPASQQSRGIDSCKPVPALSCRNTPCTRRGQGWPEDPAHNRKRCTLRRLLYVRSFCVPSLSKSRHGGVHPSIALARVGCGNVHWPLIINYHKTSERAL